MTARAAFDRLGTPAKLLLILSLIMLPIGAGLIWSASRNLEAANETLTKASAQRTRLSIRALESLIARNALALRVAANAALRDREPCPGAAATLAITPAVANQFEIEDSAGRPLCAVGDFSDVVNPPRTAPGDIRLWITEDERSLLLRAGVNGGSATARLTLAELSGALKSEGAAFSRAALDDGRKRLLLIDAPDQAPGATLSERFAIGGGRLVAQLVTPVTRITTAERLLLLLPVLMWAIAALVTWLLVNRLLIQPLRLLQRSVSSYEPGDESLLANTELGPATEIRDLRDAFVRAVDRIEETERGMAEALEGQRRLVREVHHRVKNNLQVVASLLSIHGRSADSAEGKAAFSAIGRRVDALSVVHRNHYAELEESQGIALHALLTELGSGLRASAPESHRRLGIDIDIDQASTTQDVAVAIAFFVTEVVEYAMLHAQSASVDITMRRTSELTGRLAIASKALLEPDEPSNERRQFERIVDGLARQLRSPLERRVGRYSVDIPLFPVRG